MTCVFLVCLSALLRFLAELTGHVHRILGKSNTQCRSLSEQSPQDRSPGGQNPQHWFSGEWNPQLQMNLIAAGGYHPHWRVHHAVRVHLWEPKDACAASCVHPTRASLSLRDACAAAVACAWVDCMCQASSLKHFGAFESCNG